MAAPTGLRKTNLFVATRRSKDLHAIFDEGQNRSRCVATALSIHRRVVPKRPQCELRHDPHAHDDGAGAARSLLKRYVPSSRSIALSTSLRRSADPSNDRLRVHASGG